MANASAALFMVISTGEISFAVDHEKYGWAVVFILVFFNITGMMSFMAKKIFKWNS